MAINLLIQTLSIASISTYVFEQNLIKNIAKYSFLDAHTVCYFPVTENRLISTLRMNVLTPLVVITETNVADTSFCAGYILTIKNHVDFLKVLLDINFLPNKKILLISKEDFQLTSVKSVLYEKALSLIVIKTPSSNGSSTDNIVQTFNWTPKLWSSIGKKIRVSLFHCPPYVIVGSTNAPHRFEGIDFNIFSIIAKDWPVQYFIEKEEVNIRDNLFLKIIGKVEDKEVDIAICGLWQRVIVERKLDMSQYNSQQSITFLVTKPALLDDETFIFQPFDYCIWMLVFILLALMYIFRTVFHKIQNGSSRIPPLVIISHLSLGASHFKSTRNSINILLKFWALFCVVTVTYYSAGLTRSLRFPRFSEDIKSFQDMVRYRIRWEEPVADIQGWFLQTNNSLHQEIAHLFSLENNGTVINQRLQSGNYGLLVKVVNNRYVMNGEYLDEFGKSNLKLIPGCLAEFYSVFAFQRHSPFTEIFNKEIPKFVEHGFVDHWQKMYSQVAEVRYMEKLFKNFDSEVRQKIDFSKLKGAFTILICGYVAGTLAVVLETIVHKYKRDFL